MSLEISLRDKETDEEIMSLNWLRNPFGLERWAESNVGETANLPEDLSLWYVCNTWNYDKAKEIDKQLFKKVVDNYWAVIKELEVGYFIFNLQEYRQFVERPIGKNLKIKDWHYQDNHTEIAIRMECFKDSIWLDLPSLEKYKEWFYRLVLFADRLQDPSMEFYCSN